MGLRQWLSPPRRTLTVFIAMTVAVAAALGVASWWLVLQDRDVERERRQARLGQDVDLAAVSLRNWLNEIDLKLAALLAPSSGQPDNGDRDFSWVGADSTVVMFDRSTARAWPAGRLPYYPDDATQTAPSAVAIRANALMSEARDLRLQGRAAASLAVYDRLAGIDAQVLNGAPAELVARHARCLVLGDLGRSGDLRHEAEALAAALGDRPWRLSRGIYTYYADQARQWLGAPAAPLSYREVLAAAVAALWDDWQPDGLASNARVPNDRRITWIDGKPLIVVSRGSDTHLAAFVGGAKTVSDAVRIGTAINSGLASNAIGLTDEAGRLVFGQLPASSDRVVRTIVETGLPWTIYAASEAGTADDQAGSVRRAAMLGGALVAGLGVIVGGWFAARAMHRELEVARVQADFVSAVSHEFRTPLAAFEQLSELLVDGRVTNQADREEYYRRLHRESRRLRRLVEDLLDFRRMEAGAREYRREPLRAARLISEVVDEFREEWPSRTIHANVDDLDASTCISADHEAITRALRNLLDNAAKYAPGSLITVAAIADDDRLRISVRDEGPGIPRDRQDDIFKKFVRASAPHAAAVAGTGLGLAMVRHIAEAHDGWVTLSSEPGQGATFMFEMPVVDVPRQS